MSEEDSKEMNDFRSKKVWHKSRFLVLELFTITNSLAGHDSHSLIREIRTDCVAITTNIALAHNQKSKAKRADFIQMAIALSIKLEETLAIVYAREVLGNPIYQQLVEDVTEVRQLLANFLQDIPSQGFNLE